MRFAQRPTDIARIQDLEAVTDPSDEDKVNLCCLIMRYGDDQQLGIRMTDLAIAWNHSPVTLMHECRELWQQGYSPSSPTNNSIGSANDTDSDS